MKDEKYLELLAEKYPTEQAVCREIINLKAILGLPKGTELNDVLNDDGT